MKVKECTACFKNKPINEYYRDSKNKDGLFKRCKLCVENRIKAPKKSIVQNGKKPCSWCKKVKPVEEFYPSKKETCGYRSECIQCKLEYGKKYENKSEYRQRYRDRTKDYTKKYNNEYYQDNKEHLKKHGLEYNIANRGVRKAAEKIRNENPIYRLRLRTNTVIKTAVYIKIRGNGHTYKKEAEELLGCTLEFFVDYLKSQFIDWMSFENSGGNNIGKYKNNWQIDHIIPLSFAKNEKEVILLNHWTNFQPLCAKRNNEKGAKIKILTNIELGIQTDIKDNKLIKINNGKIKN